MCRYRLHGLTAARDRAGSPAQPSDVDDITLPHTEEHLVSAVSATSIPHTTTRERNPR